MKISFGTIVFNQSILPEGMFNLCIENVIPFAHEIFIVEGATKAANGHYFDGNTGSFTSDGRSTDNTIELIENLVKKYPNKVKYISGNGFWNGKTEMCNSYAKIATGDYIWQLDSDEFYTHASMEFITQMLDNYRPDEVDFFANHFFGGFDKVLDERSRKWGNDIPWRRIFKNVPGNSYWQRHEPPTFIVNGKNCSEGNIITREQMLSECIKLYHYSYVTRKQAEFKDVFFGQTSYVKSWDEIQTNPDATIFGMNPKPFTGMHPKIIKEYYGL